VPAWSNAYYRPTPFLLVLAFRGRMKWGDHTTGNAYIHGGPRRFLMLRAAIVVAIAAVMLLVTVGWWTWRIAVVAGEIVAWAWPLIWRAALWLWREIG
jgi:hypothetical protein